MEKYRGFNICIRYMVLMLLMLRQRSTCRMPPAVANAVWHSLSLPLAQLPACLLMKAALPALPAAHFPVSECPPSQARCLWGSGRGGWVCVGSWRGEGVWLLWLQILLTVRHKFSNKMAEVIFFISAYALAMHAHEYTYTTAARVARVSGDCFRHIILSIFVGSLLWRISWRLGLLVYLTWL